MPRLMAGILALGRSFRRTIDAPFQDGKQLLGRFRPLDFVEERKVSVKRGEPKPLL